MKLTHEEAQARVPVPPEQVRQALEQITIATRSWHDFHHGTMVQCDELCEALPACEAALGWPAAPNQTRWIVRFNYADDQSYESCVLMTSDQAKLTQSLLSTLQREQRIYDAEVMPWSFVAPATFKDFCTDIEDEFHDSVKLLEAEGGSRQ